jgi:hypothetical protein
MTYKVTQTGWMLHIPSGQFVNPENNEEFLQWMFSGGIPEPADPVENIVTSLTRRQFFRALYTLDLLDGVLAVVASASDEAKLDFENATTFERNDPVLIAMAYALGKTDEDIDNLFVVGVEY